MELNFKTFGQGDPLIILHGLFGSLDNWQTAARQLAEKYSVYIIDQRNHGRSPHLDQISYPLMAQDLMAFMEGQWIYKAHIMGHSMGGKTAIQFAHDHPDMVDKLLVVDIAPKTYNAHHDDIFDALVSMSLPDINSRKEAQTVMEKKINDVTVRQFLLKNLSRTKEGQYRWKMNLPVLYEQYQNLLAGIELNDIIESPTLFIKGGTSDYIGEADRVLIGKHFAQAKIETVSGAGHWIHAEKPRELLMLVNDFLD